MSVRLCLRSAMLLVAALLLWVGSPASLADSPVVRAVLFYSPACGHCHEVMTNDLPPLLEKYGNQLQILGVNAADPAGSTLYQAAVERFDIPPENQGVPMMVLSDVVLVGSLEIPEQLPGLIEKHLAEGGVDWPDIPGLAEALTAGPAAAAPTAAVAATESLPDLTATPAQVAVAPADSDPGLLLPASQPDNLSSRLARDPVGNALAILVLLGMIAAVILTVVTFLRPPARPRPTWADWAIPVLALIGLAVAGYLAYVETTQTRAVCGPVGDCNTVQQSDYALILGLIPVGVFGAAGYVAVLAVWAIGRLSDGRAGEIATVLLFALTAFGVLFSIYLTFLEPFVIGATCAWCLSSAVIMTVLMLLSARPAAQVFAGNSSAT